MPVPVVHDVRAGEEIAVQAPEEAIEDDSNEKADVKEIVREVRSGAEEDLGAPREASSQYTIYSAGRVLCFH